MRNDYFTSVQRRHSRNTAPDAPFHVITARIHVSQVAGHLSALELAVAFDAQLNIQFAHS